MAEHNTRDDCWIILDDRVYDITRFIDAHPGGVLWPSDECVTNATQAAGSRRALRLCARPHELHAELAADGRMPRPVCMACVRSS